MDSADNAYTCFIGELPDELLVRIVEQLRVERGFLAGEEAEQNRCYRNAVTVHSIHALTRTCRKLNAVATPFLYQCIIWSPKRLFVPLLFRTLFSRPRLNRHVRYIEFAQLDDSDIENLEEPDRYKFNEQIVWLFSQLIPRLTELSSPREPCGRKIIVAMLSMMDNLQDASLPDQDEVNVILAKTPHAGSLRRLWLTSRPWEREPWHYGCVLRTITSGAKDGQGQISRYLSRFFVHDWPEPASQPIIEEISLVVDDMHPRILEGYIRNCASLKRFSCRWEWTDSIPRNDVNLPLLHTALQHIRQTLTHLTIDTSESASRVDMDANIPAMGSLRMFEALTYLDVAGLVLWGDGDNTEPAPLSSILPESLETLIIKEEWDDDIEIALHELSVDCAVSLPNLKTIQCTWRPAPKFTADLLKEAFRTVAVDISLDIEAD